MRARGGANELATHTRMREREGGRRGKGGGERARDARGMGAGHERVAFNFPPRQFYGASQKRNTTIATINAAVPASERESGPGPSPGWRWREAVWAALRVKSVDFAASPLFVCYRGTRLVLSGARASLYCCSRTQRRSLAVAAERVAPSLFSG